MRTNSVLGDLGSSSDVFGDRGVKIGVDGMLPCSDSLLGNSWPYLLVGLPIITLKRHYFLTLNSINLLFGYSAF